MADRPYDYLSALGARISIARNELGMSQAKLAEALGISLRAYQSYELGKRSIPVEGVGRDAPKVRCGPELDFVGS